jgi:hypothetical protein
MKPEQAAIRRQHSRNMATLIAVLDEYSAYNLDKVAGNDCYRVVVHSQYGLGSPELVGSPEEIIEKLAVMRRIRFR